MSLKSLALATLALATAGCLGDPTVDLSPPRLDTQVERVAWEPAPAGCEGADPRGLTLAACEGEPLLGALIGRAGEVRCVDSLSLLRVELTRFSGIDPLAGDPSPQPNYPRPDDDHCADPAHARVRLAM